jgi:hypothetical protein
VTWNQYFAIQLLQPFQNGVGLRTNFWGENIHQSMKDCYILYDDRFSKDKQLLLELFLWETKNTNVMHGSKLKFIPSFMETTYAPLHLDKRCLVQQRDADTRRPESLIWCLTELLSTAAAWNVVVMFGQALNVPVKSSLVLCNVVRLWNISLVK